MEWMRIGLASVVVTAISAGTINMWFFRPEKRRKAKKNPNYRNDEKQRAQKIALGIGTAVVQATKFAGGVAATIPIIALLIFIISGSRLPEIIEVGRYMISYFGGCIVMAWGHRIAEALDENT